MALVQVRHPATFIVAALIAPLAPADCVDGVRQATPAEREAAQRGWAALLAGLPEAVRPLERRTPKRGDPAAPATFSACRDTPIGAFSPAAAEGYMYQFPREEAAARSEQRRALQRQVEELEKLPPEKEAQRKEIEAQMRAAYAAAPTRSRKDPPFTAEQQAQVDRQGRPVVRFQTAQNRDVVARLDATTGAITASVDLGPTAFSSSLNTLTFDSAGNTYAGLARMFHQSLLYGPGGASDRAIWAFLMV